MPAKVGRDDVMPLRPAELGQPLEPLAVSRDAVEADERSQWGVSPFVHVEPHSGHFQPMGILPANGTAQLPRECVTESQVKRRTGLTPPYGGNPHV